MPWCWFPEDTRVCWLNLTGGVTINPIKGKTVGKGCFSPRKKPGRNLHQSASYGFPLPGFDVVLVAELFHALVLVLLHRGDELVPGADLLGLPGDHHGVCADGWQELGVSRPLLSHHQDL